MTSTPAATNEMVQLDQLGAKAFEEGWEIVENQLKLR